MALVNRRDANHERVLDAFASQRGPHVVPAAVLGELGYMLDRDVGVKATTAFMFDLAEGAFELDCGEHDLVRAASIAERYGDLPLGLVDAMVIACAERRGGRVLTLDRRHFDVVARDIPLEILP